MTSTNNERGRLDDAKGKAKMPSLFTDETFGRFEQGQTSRRLNDEEMGPGIRSRSRVAAKVANMKVLLGERTPTSEERYPTSEHSLPKSAPSPPS
jgi:hypothetical protein